MRPKLIAILSIISIVLSGCITKYHWGNYENSLYTYYKKPSEVVNLSESLAKIIEDGETQGGVPPGIYAEYGYTLHVLGKPQEAITYFEKEKNAWPESQILMDKMIDLIKTPVEKSRQGTE